MTAGARVALVGCGRWGARILDALVRLGAETCVVDPDPRARAAARRAGAAAVTDDLAGTADAAGVVVATPAATHTGVLEAVRAHTGVPLFCEKPLCVTAAEGERLARLDGALYVMHVWRYHPGVEAVGALLRGGAAGRPTRIRSTRTNGASPRLDVDPVTTLVPHDLSIAVELLGGLPAPVRATATVVDGRARALTATLGEEPPFELVASDLDEPRRRTLRVDGDAASLVLDADGPQAVRIHGPDGTPQATHPFDPTPPLDRQLAAFLAHLGGGPPPKSDRAEGIAVVETLLRLRELAGG